MTLPQTIISHSTADFNTRDGVATEHALARGYGLSRAFTHKTLKKIKDGVPDLGWGEPTWALVKGGPDKGGVEEALWLFDDAIIEIFSSYGGQCGVLVRCDDAAVAEPYIARFVEIFPTHTDPEPEEDNKVHPSGGRGQPRSPQLPQGPQDHPMARCGRALPFFGAGGPRLAGGGQ